MNEKSAYYWNRFLKTGSIKDYLNYKLYDKMTENEDGKDREATWSRNQEE